MQTDTTQVTTEKRHAKPANEMQFKLSLWCSRPEKSYLFLRLLLFLGILHFALILLFQITSETPSQTPALRQPSLQLINQVLPKPKKWQPRSKKRLFSMSNHQKTEKPALATTHMTKKKPKKGIIKQSSISILKSRWARESGPKHWYNLAALPTPNRKKEPASFRRLQPRKKRTKQAKKSRKVKRNVFRAKIKGKPASLVQKGHLRNHSIQLYPSSYLYRHISPLFSARKELKSLR